MWQAAYDAEAPFQYATWRRSRWLSRNVRSRGSLSAGGASCAAKWSALARKRGLEHQKRGRKPSLSSKRRDGEASPRRRASGRLCCCDSVEGEKNSASPTAHCSSSLQRQQWRASLSRCGRVSARQVMSNSHQRLSDRALLFYLWSDLR